MFIINNCLFFLIFYKKINNVFKNISLHVNMVNDFFEVDIFINFNSNIWREIKLKNLYTLYFYLKRKQFMLIKIKTFIFIFFLYYKCNYFTLYIL